MKLHNDSDLLANAIKITAQELAIITRKQEPCRMAEFLLRQKFLNLHPDCSTWLKGL